MVHDIVQLHNTGFSKMVWMINWKITQNLLYTNSSKSTMGLVQMSITLLARVKEFQAHPANTGTTMLTEHIITSFNLFNSCCTLGATFAHSWIHMKPFLKLLFTVFSSLIHGTGQAIMVLIMTLGAEVDPTMATNESFSII